MNKPKVNPLNTVRTLVREGKLDDDTARLLNSVMVQSAAIRDELRAMLESYRHILDSVAVVRGNLNTVLDNVQDVENYAED